MNHERLMRQALRLAERGAGNTSPNPMVGALVTSEAGEVIGSGFHDRAGGDHAEVVALREAGPRAQGATLFVTLEPCSHHGRTPPCVQAIVQAKVARVVSAMEDPDQRVRGAAHELLRASGIEVLTGVEQDKAVALNRAYVKHRLTRKPFVTLKMAQSLNAAVAHRAGERVTLTGKRANTFTRRLRYEHDAVMVGVGTILVDDPQLTVRPYKARFVPYSRIVVDAAGRVPRNAKILKDQERFKTVIATTSAMPSGVREELASRGISLLECVAGDDGLVDLDDLLSRLGGQEIMSVLCEGGPTLAGSLVRRHLADSLLWIVAPLFLGGEQPVPALGSGPSDIAIQFGEVKRLGDDMLMSARLRR